MPEPIDQAAEIADLKQRIAILENHVEAYIWCYQTRVLDTPTLSMAIRQALSEHYQLSQHEITGATQVGNGRGQGFALRNKTSYDLKLMQVREWIVLLMRQCCHTERETLREIYPWCFGTVYTAALTKLKALYQNPQHPDRSLWLNLLTLVRNKAQQIHADTSALDYELTLVSAEL